MNLDKKVESLEIDVNQILKDDTNVKHFLMKMERAQELQAEIELQIIDNFTEDNQQEKILLKQYQIKMEEIVKSLKTKIKEMQYIQINKNDNLESYRKLQLQLTCTNLIEASNNVDDVLSDLDIITQLNDTIMSTIYLDLKRLDLVSDTATTVQQELRTVKTQLSEVMLKVTKGKQKKIILFIILTILLILSIFDFCFRLMQLRVENSTVI
ncbi:hypothetical protein SS50377_25936 [Spironucleus salmonicida]|uniref:Uncharacterized protein n=1 Tax=Spironucleus salmonicida TaxID=348837 RepID=V6LTQ2_9EUKA|nr:hypothetical protein SS50377_25936 [Spironucleus salmonicida]|eukprot:EST47081.1 Hypothetical protein SS50377_12854 [Spironucleus salmonicida]